MTNENKDATQMAFGRPIWFEMRRGLWYLRSVGYLKQNDKGEWWFVDDIYSKSPKQEGPYSNLWQAKAAIEKRMIGKN